MKFFKRNRMIIATALTVLIILCGVITINADMTCKNQYLEKNQIVSENQYGDSYKDIFLREEDRCPIKIYIEEKMPGIKVKIGDYKVVFGNKEESNLIYNFKTNISYLKKYVESKVFK